MTRTTRAVAWLAEYTGGVIAALGACMLVAYLASVLIFPKPGGRIVVGDAVHHFVQLRSLVYDRDADFENEYAHLYRLQHPDDPQPDWNELRTPTGHIRNYMPVGPALLWAPLYLLISGVLAVLSAAGLARAPDGFEPVLQLAPGITGVLAATAAAWFAWRLAIRLTDRASAALGALGVWLGTQAIYYSLVSPAYSHAASMLTSAIVFTHWIEARDQWSWRRAAASGALVGLASLMRWQDALLLAIPFVESLRWRGGMPTGRACLAALGAAGAGWLLAFSPQMAIWQVLYGSPFTVPQGPSFMQWLAPNPWAVLWAAKHGLFSWSPLLLLAGAGLVSLVRRDRSLLLPITCVVLATWYVNAAVADWWGGEAFGARRFLSLFPLFVVGLAAWVRPSLQAGRSGRAILVLGLVVANGLFLIQYQVFMKGLLRLPYPDRSWFDLWLMRFVVPFRLIGQWLR